MKPNKLFKSLMLIPIVGLIASCKDTTPKYHIFDRENEKLTLNEVETFGSGIGHLCPSQGNTRVLVIPISFTDFPAGKIADIHKGNEDQSAGLIDREGGAEAAKEDIRKAYFGTPEETQWYSLAEYYKRSSYGKQNFNGLVLPWTPAFTDNLRRTPVSAREFKEGGGNAAKLISAIYARYVEILYVGVDNPETGKKFESGEEFARYFDSNNDGCVDVIEAVYSAPYQVKDALGEIDNELFWAYCGSSTMNANKNCPTMSKWAWQSYYTFYSPGYTNETGHHHWTQEEMANGTAKVDAHTLIHETGHAQGLADYYDYDNKKAPTGNVDMMDHNIGDHNSYSKSLYGWVDPICITGPTTITVKSFTEYGDCIYVAYKGYWDDSNENENKNTIYNEYIGIELYTPTGVNEYDTTHSYQGIYPFTPSIVGLKVWHVDSRLGLWSYPTGNGGGDGPTFAGHVDRIPAHSDRQVVKCAADNTGSRSYDKDANLLETLPNSQHALNSEISDKTLWKQGDVFGSNNNYENFTFNSGKAFGFKFSVDEIVSNGKESTATITFTLA